MYKLSNDMKRRYTLVERNLFAVLPKSGKRIGSADIVNAHGKDWVVKFPLKNITVTMNRLIGKVDDNREDFRIMKEGKSQGHHLVEYWLEERRRPGRKKANGK